MSIRVFPGRLIRAAKLAARDTRIPRVLRSAAGLGLLPLPGPIDEAILLLVAPVLFVFYREPMRDAWARAGGAARVARPPPGRP